MLKSPKIWSNIAILLLGVLLSSAGTVLAQIEQKEMIGEGMAAGSSLISREEALNRALRDAIEKGVGVLIDSETIVQNFQLLDDKVYSQVKGYVKSYEIAGDNQGEGGIYRIKVKAVVALGALRKSIKGLNIVLEKKGRPRVMAVFSESIDGLEQPGAVVQTEMEKAFLENNFPLIDRAQMEMVKSRDAALSYADPSKAAALGRRYGAEVVIVGQAASDLMDTSKPYGVSVYAYQAQVSARVIKVDTAGLMVSESVESVQRGGGRIPTAKKSLKDAGRKLSDLVMKQIVEKWRSEVYNLTSIQLICENATFDKLNLLKAGLRNLGAVESVSERSFVNQIGIIDLQMAGDANMLAAKLREFTDPLVDITGKTQNRIDLKFLE
ncbi:MAG: hypothetical protein U9Q08_05050 [Candidatus Omnitrophota bacterium]|nr:hypothetical protein [Candidatus Omnitrophota bacterium]